MADNKIVASRDRKVYLFREAAAALREPITVAYEPNCGHDNAEVRRIRANTCPDCGACLEHWD